MATIIHMIPIFVASAVVECSDDRSGLVSLVPVFAWENAGLLHPVVFFKWLEPSVDVTYKARIAVLSCQAVLFLRGFWLTLVQFPIRPADLLNLQSNSQLSYLCQVVTF